MPLYDRDVIIACDFSGRDETLKFLNSLGELRPWLKIGMELFYAEGPDFVRELKGRGYRIFFDLKLHDIPTTVSRTMSVLSRLDVDMINVHAAGTRAMMEAALSGAIRPDGSRPILLAVTQLTSTDEERMQKELLIHASMQDTVLAYAENASLAGLDGVVCSAWEAGIVRRRCGEQFCTVTPGIRFAEGEAADQKRVATPSLAAELGSQMIVVGRPITRSEDPKQAYIRCRQEFLGKDV